VDLLDFGSPRFGYRRLGVLIEGLPTHSRLKSKWAADAPRNPVSDEDEEAMWRLEHHLLAQVIDHLAAANWQRGGKGARPKPVPRPGVKSGKENVIKKRPKLTVDQKRRVLAAIAPPGSKIGDNNG